MKASWLPGSLRLGVQCAGTGRSAANRASIPQRHSLINSPSAKALTTSSRALAAGRGDTPRGRSLMRKKTIETEFKEFGEEEEVGEQEEKIFYARLLPESPAYFSSKPGLTDDYIQLKRVLRKHQGLPILKPSEAPRTLWKPLNEYRGMVGEMVPQSKYERNVGILRRLNLISRDIMPDDVKEVIKLYARDIDPYKNVPKPGTIDRHGKAEGHGRRKTATATAFLMEGTGEVRVNGKTIAEVFGRIHDRETVLWPLKITGRIDKYNVWARAVGGGTTGQAEALTLAVAKALLVHEPAMKPALRRAGCVTRDPRTVERKKPGRVKARKMPAWVKR